VNPAAVVALNFLIYEYIIQNTIQNIEYRIQNIIQKAAPSSAKWILQQVVALNFIIVYRKPLHQQESESCSSSSFKLYNSLQKAAPSFGNWILQ
jgi:hypothetical protein